VRQFRIFRLGRILDQLDEPKKVKDLDYLGSENTLAADCILLHRAGFLSIHAGRVEKEDFLTKSEPGDLGSLFEAFPSRPRDRYDDELELEEALVGL